LFFLNNDAVIAEDGEPHAIGRELDFLFALGTVLRPFDRHPLALMD